MRPRARAILIGIPTAVLAVAALLSRQGHETLDTPSPSLTGELVVYQASRQDLTLRTGDDEWHFEVREGTPVREAARAISLADLAKAGRCRAKVRYRQGAGRPVAQEIRISCNVPRTPGPRP